MNDNIKRSTVLANLETLQSTYVSPVKRDAVDDVINLIKSMQIDSDACSEPANASTVEPEPGLVRSCGEVRGIFCHKYFCARPVGHAGAHEFRLAM